MRRVGRTSLARNCFLVCSILGAIWLSSVPASAQIIANGNFGTGNFSGWTQGGNLGFTQVCNFNCAGIGGYPGGNYAELGPIGSTGSLSQTFTLPSAGAYTLSFLLGSNPGIVDSFTASIDGTNVFGPVTSGNGFNFTAETVGFSGVAGTNTLAFTFQQDNSFFGLADVAVTGCTDADGAVCVTPAPGPSPGAGFLSYLAIGLLCLGLAGWKRWRKNFVSA
jgi:hypothetical protein